MSLEMFIYKYLPTVIIIIIILRSLAVLILATTMSTALISDAYIVSTCGGHFLQVCSKQ